MTVKTKLFQSKQKTWPQMAKEVAAFVATLPPDAVVSISHSCDRDDSGLFVVFYRE
jgi:hypothetical protein